MKSAFPETDRKVFTYGPRSKLYWIEWDGDRSLNRYVLWTNSQGSGKSRLGAYRYFENALLQLIDSVKTAAREEGEGNKDMVGQ